MIEKILKCTHCRHPISGRKYCYSGSCYCSGCFPIFSKFKICTSCKKRRRILDRINPPICQKCRFKDLPCARCGRPEYDIGRITEIGPVCGSCANSFRVPKICTYCRNPKRNVSHRNLDGGSNKLICDSCFNKTLPTCSQCRYQKKPYLYSLNKKPICKICAIEGTRKCKSCDTDIPAGIGHHCETCGYSKTLLKRTNKGKEKLSHFFADTFFEFSDWLNNRRGLVFSTTHIQHYLSFFIELDKIAVKLNRIPTYEDETKAFHKINKKLSFVVSTFLNEYEIIPLDSKIKDECDNLIMIEVKLEKFEAGTFYKKTIAEYHAYLNNKLKAGKTSVRSIRLALTPAVILFEWCEHFGLTQPTNQLLYGLLWHSPGRRAGITGFINFLNRQTDLNLSLPDKEKLIFTRPNESKNILKQKFIRLLRSPSQNNDYQEEVLKAAIAYLHYIQVPEHVIVTSSVIKKNHACRLSNQIFYLPKAVPIYQ